MNKQEMHEKSKELAEVIFKAIWDWDGRTPEMTLAIPINALIITAWACIKKEAPNHHFVNTLAGISQRIMDEWEDE